MANSWPWILAVSSISSQHLFRFWSQEMTWEGKHESVKLLQAVGYRFALFCFGFLYIFSYSQIYYNAIVELFRMMVKIT